MEIAKKAINEAYWPGRYEIKNLNKLRYDKSEGKIRMNL